ncbi:hypothetical protein FO519_003836 [Halicephalobus sp. NKZ332]|nr:hypothetical protein FO519_003836 [Halicephalobus sp. NKZ332]
MKNLTMQKLMETVINSSIMVRRRGASPKASAPVRSRASPQQQSSYSSAPPPRPTAAPVPTPTPMPGAAPSRGPGLMGQMAATAGGVAIGSAVGHAVGNMFTGGSGGHGEAAPAPAPDQQYAPQQQVPMQPCEVEWRQLVECTQRQSDLSVCQAFQDLFKDCKGRNGL